MTKKTYRQRFTLIEMLVVIGVASLLFALLGPAFNQMLKGNVVERHASGLKLGMERARALAISNRRYVALLLPDKVTDDTSEAYKYQRGGCRIAFVSQTPDGYEFDGWSPGDEWGNKLNGAYLTKLTDSRDVEYGKNANPIKEDEMFSEGISDIKNHLLPIKELPSDIKVSTAYGIVFTAFGEMKTKSTGVELYFYVAGETDADHLKIRINKLTGKVEFVE